MSEPLAITLPLGLPGLTLASAFTLRWRSPGSAYAWLEAHDDASLVLLTVDVLRIAPDYPVEQLRRQLGFLRLAPDEPLWAQAVCTVPSEPDPVTVNLVAPIGIGRHGLRGAQVVLHDPRWSDRTPLPTA